MARRKSLTEEIDRAFSMPENSENKIYGGTKMNGKQRNFPP